VRLPKKFNVPKSVFCPRLFSQASATPRPENSDSEKNDTLFALDTQIAIIKSYKRTGNIFWDVQSKHIIFA
jgi:hypothetical protein